ncbi:MAG: UDP-N-acetylmuramate:L-alanyl-gamma-D-glutamyl-meso-diaminopimelate ligase [Desulfobacterales bacterium]|nr:UDP-N-acetylmuramate:L-alanyl-gamma-D-glutamyl-meso-diaminopimelate ligase [Desulfobacterales bacterium]
MQENEPKAELLPSLNKAPKNPHHIHLMGICGTGMASLAGMLKQKGYLLSGSDENVYPPMSHFLEGLSIPVFKGYGPHNLSSGPDLVVVGNVITSSNPEAVELFRLKLPYLSFPQALKHFVFRDKRTIVISGTHGKTGTSALVSWILEKAGLDPGFMIGGIPKNFQAGFKLGQGDYFVIEGDEYDTAFFDKGPKFLHYNPWAAILTSIEFDHADIYRDLEHVTDSFRKFIRLLPPEGLLIANGDDEIIAREIKGAECPVKTYGLSNKNLFRALEITDREDLTRFKVLKGGKEYMTLLTPLYGRHNISNLLSAVILADFMGVPSSIISDAALTFEGVKRRQEIIGEKQGILVLDDFAHHPTAVKETINAVKEKYAGRRLMVVFEARSNSSMRDIFQTRYASSFDKADIVMIPEPALIHKIPPGERFSSRRLVKDLQGKGLKALYSPGNDQLLETIVKESRPGDVILIMSNGGFGDIQARVLERL